MQVCHQKFLWIHFPIRELVGAPSLAMRGSLLYFKTLQNQIYSVITISNHHCVNEDNCVITVDNHCIAVHFRQQVVHP